MPSLLQVALSAWAKTKQLQHQTIDSLRARTRKFKSQLNEHRPHFDFSYRLLQFTRRTDSSDIPAGFLLSSVSKLFSLDDLRVYDKYYGIQKEKRKKKMLQAQWYKIIKYLGNAESTNSTVEIYSDGSEAFSSMWYSIRNAKSRIWMQTYILKPDAIGFRTITELTNASKRGVSVVLIYDHLGSLGFDDDYFQELRSHHGAALSFNDISSYSHYLSMRNYTFFRNHRKILVIDNDCGFCGGMNVSADYCDINIGGNGRFRDTHAKIQGAGVSHLADVFLDTLTVMSKMKQLPESLHLKLIEMNQALIGPHRTLFIDKDLWLDAASDLHLSKQHPMIFLQVLASKTSKNKRAIQKSLSSSIDMAQTHVYLTSPYFLPPFKIRLAITRAARRGVDVRVLTAGKTDIPLLNAASNHIYGLFLKNNVRVYELHSKELHAKTVTADGLLAMVGSYNLDNLSYKHNLEANLNIIDRRIAVKIEKDFFEDLKMAKEIIRHRWENRSFMMRCWNWLVYTIFTFIMK